MNRYFGKRLRPEVQLRVHNVSFCMIVETWVLRAQGQKGIETV